MQTWNVFVPRLENRKLISLHIGTVEEDTEALARKAACSKFGITEDEYYDAIDRGENQPKGISPGDDFSVQAV